MFPRTRLCCALRDAHMVFIGGGRGNTGASPRPQPRLRVSRPVASAPASADAPNSDTDQYLKAADYSVGCLSA